MGLPLHLAVSCLDCRVFRKMGLCSDKVMALVGWAGPEKVQSESPINSD